MPFLRDLAALLYPWAHFLARESCMHGRRKAAVHFCRFILSFEPRALAPARRQRGQGPMRCANHAFLTLPRVLVRPRLRALEYIPTKATHGRASIFLPEFFKGRISAAEALILFLSSQIARRFSKVFGHFCCIFCTLAAAEN